MLLLCLPTGCTKKKEQKKTALQVPGPREEVEQGSPAADATLEVRPVGNPPGEPDPNEEAERLQELLDEVVVRAKCNIVMGCEAGEKLVDFGPAAIPSIIERYGQLNRPSYQKFHLVELLGSIGDVAAVPFLSSLLQDPHWNARSNAAWALAEAGARGQRARLEGLLAQKRDGRDFGFVCALAYAVEKLGGTGGKEVLLKALAPDSIASRNTGFTRIAVRAAGDLRMVEACLLLRVAIEHQELFLSKEAMRAAAALGCRQLEVHRAIAVNLNDRVPSARREAVSALKRLTGYELKTYEQWQKLEEDLKGDRSRSH